MSMSNSQEVLTSTSGAKKRSRVRIVILLLLSVGTMINYLDRTILGIVAPQLSKEIHIDPAMMGIIFSAFAWTYALAQIPGGMFLDRYGNKLTYALSIFFWSLFTLLQSFTLGLKSLLLLRLGLGVSEAPCFPANSRIVSTWFPQHERARATATYTVGEYIGLAAFSPLLFLILEHHGWRTLFFLTGGLGILFTLVWWRFIMNRMNRARLIKRSWSISAQTALTIKSRTFHLTGVTPDACWAVARSSAPAWVSSPATPHWSFS